MASAETTRTSFAFTTTAVQLDKSNMRPTTTSWEDLNHAKFVSMTLAMQVGSKFVFHPASLIKTRIQVGAESSSSSLLHAVRSISAAEGFRGLYKGLAPGLISPALSPVYFAVFEYSKSKLRKVNSELSNESINFMAGSMASCARQTFAVPASIVSQKMMLQKHLNPTIGGTIVSIFRTSGYRAFYRGYFTTIMTFAPSSAVMWSVYSVMTSNFVKMDSPFEARSAQTFLCALTGGLLAALLTNPMDVVRVRQQNVEGKGLFWKDIASEVYKKKGFKGFFLGLNARLVSTAPQHALTICGYEIVKFLCRKD